MEKHLKPAGLMKRKGDRRDSNLQAIQRRKKKEVKVGYSRFLLELSHAQCQLLLLLANQSCPETLKDSGGSLQIQFLILIADNYTFAHLPIHIHKS